MTGPTRAPAALATDLAALSEQAYPSPWTLDGSGVLMGFDYDGPAAHVVGGVYANERRTAAYIAALVNAHRAGHLVTLDAALDWVAEQLADPEVVEAVARATAPHVWLGTPLGADGWVNQERAAARDRADRGLTAALAALRDRAAPRAPQPDTTHDTEEQQGYCLPSLGETCGSCHRCTPPASSAVPVARGAENEGGADDA